MSEQIKRAWCDVPKFVVVDPNGFGLKYDFSISAATDLRDQLTAAIEKAKGADPFEEWWQNWIPGREGYCQRNIARAIWDAAVYAQEKKT